MISLPIALAETECRPIAKGVLRFSLIFSLMLFFSVFDTVNAAVIPANSDSLSDVQSAVNSANPGDTVQVPAGTATWTGTLTINTDIQLIGAGIGKTIIVDGGSPNALQLIGYTTSANHLDRISGFTFQGGNNAESWGGTIGVDGTCHSFRVDNCEFYDLENYDIFFDGWVYGCVDHCQFYSTVNVGIEIKMQNFDNQYSYGDGAWADSDYWGTTNAIYVETCTFNNNGGGALGAIDSCDGAHWVFRYNNATNTALANHGTETSSRERSSRAEEVYENNFSYDYNNNGSWPQAVYIRGGTALIWSNTISGGYKYLCTVAAYRQWVNNWSPWGYYNQWDGVSPWNPIDTNNPTVYGQGTASVASSGSLTDNSQNWAANQWTGYWLANVNSGIASGISGNSGNTITVVPGYDDVSGSGIQSGTNLTFGAGQGYMIFSNVATIDQPGRGQGDLIADTIPGNGMPYDTVTGKTNWPNEVSDPLYEWGNNMTWAYPQGAYQQANYIVSQNVSVLTNRDYFDGVVKPGYTPLPYPHPLAGGSPVTPTFILTVAGGTGGNSYTNGAIALIVANAANTSSNGPFAFWTGLHIANTNSASTSVTMPNSNLTVTAIYAPIPPATLRVTNTVP